MPLRILILRFSSLGDLVLTTSTLSLLKKKFPEKAEIFFATHEKYSEILENNPNITKILKLKKNEGILKFIKKIKKEEITHILDLHNKLRSKFIRLFFLGTPTSVWKNRTFTELFPLPRKLKSFKSRIFFAKKFELALDDLSKKIINKDKINKDKDKNNNNKDKFSKDKINNKEKEKDKDNKNNLKPEKGLIQYFPKKEELEFAKNLLLKNNIKLNKKIVGVAVGSVWNTKKWLPEYFIELIAKIISKNFQVILIGALAEKNLIEEIKNSFIKNKNKKLISYFYNQNLRTSSAIIANCNIFVSNDSGPMHIARALGIPTLAIFGSTDPNMFDLSEHTLAYNNISCSPCGFNGKKNCPEKHFKCMKDLKPDYVWNLLEKLLNNKKLNKVNLTSY